MPVTEIGMAFPALAVAKFAAASVKLRLSPGSTPLAVRPTVATVVLS